MNYFGRKGCVCGWGGGGGGGCLYKVCGEREEEVRVLILKPVSGS